MNGIIITVLSIFALANSANVIKSSAEEICAAPDSEGQLVEHQECSKFYECSGGVPVAFSCPENLHYNDEKKVCDYPENVVCDRALPVNAEPEQNGINPENEASAKVQVVDNLKNNVDSEDKSYAEKAAEVCAAQDSDGVLLPHGDCDKFYECSRGVAFTLQCPKNPRLLYNTEYQYCDWAAQVDCGDREQ